ncbi:hypothetical protein FQA39_LY15371 [Lamprigera yunnana]|nr:hypothetical protein FQA39_LY15371 [Lamprigera yunnana]
MTIWRSHNEVTKNKEKEKFLTSKPLLTKAPNSPKSFSNLNNFYIEYREVNRPPVFEAIRYNELPFNGPIDLKTNMVPTINKLRHYRNVNIKEPIWLIFILYFTVTIIESMTIWRSHNEVTKNKEKEKFLTSKPLLTKAPNSPKSFSNLNNFYIEYREVNRPPVFEAIRYNELPFNGPIDLKTNMVPTINKLRHYRNVNIKEPIWVFVPNKQSTPNG